MARAEFDVKELSKFTQSLLRTAKKDFPKESLQFMKKQGMKLKRRVVSRAKARVGKVTGNYLKSIKEGKSYLYNGTEPTIRVYSSAPHSHLIENPHKTRNGSLTQGTDVFAGAVQGFVSDFESDTEAFVDELIERGLK